jgi:hypothetical protein
MTTFGVSGVDLHADASMLGPTTKLIRQCALTVTIRSVYVFAIESAFGRTVLL